MIDLQALREAIEVPARPVPDTVRDMRGFYALPLDVLDQRTAANNALLDAPEVWWCEYHHAESSGENGVCIVADMADRAQGGKGIWNGVNCESVRVALVRIGDE